MTVWSLLCDDWLQMSPLWLPSNSSVPYMYNIGTCIHVIVITQCYYNYVMQWGHLFNLSLIQFPLLVLYMYMYILYMYMY